MFYILATYPVFVSYPTPQHVNLTQTAIFTCNATGYNVSYQWTVGSGSFPSKVIGINSNTLVIPDVRSSDDNTYTCVASNEGGNASSNDTKLTVIGMAVIVKHKYQLVHCSRNAQVHNTVGTIVKFIHALQ